jgi:hypothetical protein
MVMRAASFVVSSVLALIDLAAGLRTAPQAAPGAVLAQNDSASASSDGRIVTAGLFDWLFGEGQRGEPPRSEPSPPAGYRDDDDERGGWRERPGSGGGTYRTLCVRLCDGFPFPISFATTRDGLRADAGRCEQQCPSRARLFAYRNPDQSLDQMVDLDGKAYKDLPTAFRYQSVYVPDCTCNGNPWDPEALARHEAYAHQPPPNDKQAGDNPAKSAERSPAAEPPRRTRQSGWGYRDRRADRRARRDDDD